MVETLGALVAFFVGVSLLLALQNSHLRRALVARDRLIDHLQEYQD